MRKFFLFLIISAASFPVLLPALTSGESQHTRAQLISEVESIQPGGVFYTALHLQMDPHWHTYWQNPGDSGIPTTLRWDLPEGFQAGSIEWMYPSRFEMPPLTVYGYEDEVFLLVRLQAPADLVPGSQAELRVRADWLECELICIPAHANLTLTLPVAASVPAVSKEWAGAFAHARASLPLVSDSWKVSAQTDSENLLLRIVPESGASERFRELYFFPKRDDLIDHAAEQHFVQTEKGLELLIKRSNLLAAAPDQLEGVLVGTPGWRGQDSERALAVDVPLEAAGAPLALSASPLKLTWAAALFFAFAGGLILNLMPCVFPVLSLKITHFVEEASHDPQRVWRQGLVFTFGVLVSFWILAGVLMFLKEAGHQIGWGFQLQSPVFLLILISVFWMLALNLFGFYEIGAAMTRVGQYTIHKHGLGGAFLSGVLATVVATPCTAPFMGAALGFALTQPAAIALGVFTALGAGMALPYLLLSLFPPLLSRLPRPGLWMIRLKKFMGLLLAATVAWLGWVLFLQTGIKTIAAACLMLLILFAVAYLYGRYFQSKSLRWSFPLGMLMLAAVLLSLLTSMGISRYEHGQDLFQKQRLYNLDWKDFSPELVDELRASGQPFFVDFTAAWCLSCQVNERLVFGSGKVREEIQSLGIVLVKADWTYYSPEITQALAAFGRSSIPFYVLYVPGREPVVLPEILTPGVFLKSLQENFPDRD